MIESGLSPDSMGKVPCLEGIVPIPTLEDLKNDPVIGEYMAYTLSRLGVPEDEAGAMATPDLSTLKNDPLLGYYTNALLAIMVAGLNPDGTAWSMRVTEGKLTPLGYEQITSLSASTALTVPTGATYALIEPETQAVRWRDGGTAPTATVGKPLAVGSELAYAGDLAAIRFIEQAASAKLNVCYYKRG